MPDEQLTIGLAAVRIGGGVQAHHLRRLANRNAIKVTRAGRFHLIAAQDLPQVRDACRAAGYYRGDTNPTPAAPSAT